MGFGLVIGFIAHLHVVTTSKDNALTVLHTSQITIGQTRSHQHVKIFTSRCLVTASNGRRSPSSGIPKYHGPQLPVSNSNRSRRLNRNGYPTH
jgi:hypothetical protein